MDGCCSYLDRRALLGAAAVGAAYAPFLAAPLPAKTIRRPGILDIHHHIVPPAVAGSTRDTGWSAQAAVEGMDRAGIAAGIASTGPLVIGDAKQRPALARSANEFGATVARDHPGWFGLFAALPLPDVATSLEEIDHALDHLSADGFVIATSYDDKWLGDEALWPVWEKLDARSAVVFVHPHDAACCLPQAMTYSRTRVPGPAITGAYIEWPMNTARAIFSLMVSGTLRRFPRIRFIVAHGGGVMPLLVQRLAGFSGSPISADRVKAYFPNGVAAEFASLHFECAQAFSPPNIAALRALVPDRKLLFGSDYPAFTLDYAVQQFNGLPLSLTTRNMIAFENGAALLPRWV